MVDVVDDFVVENSSTTGTGTYSLSGPPGGSAYRGFVQAFTTGKTIIYVARREDNTKWEICYGVITDGSPDTLTRTLIKSSTGALIDWASDDVSPDPLVIYSFPAAFLLSAGLAHFRGTTAPAYALAGWIWEDTSGGATAVAIKIYDGSDWIQFLTINETANTVALPSSVFASSGEVATGTESAKAVAPDTLAANVHYQGKQTAWIPANAWTPRTTNGAARGSSELSTNKVMLSTLDFDGSTAEYAQFIWSPPKEWDEGTITFIPIWTGSAGAGGVVFRLSGVAVSNDDALDVAQGTAQTSTDTFLTANDLHRGPESSAITISGTPAEGDSVILEVSRNPADGSDTKAEDAKLLGVLLFFSTNAKNSA